MQFIYFMVKLNFQQPLLQSSVSHDTSEIILISWFDTPEIFLIINVEKSCAAYHFCGNRDFYLFFCQKDF